MDDSIEVDDLHAAVFDIVNNHIKEYYNDVLITTYRNSSYDSWGKVNGRWLVVIDRTSNIAHVRRKFRKRKLLVSQLKLLGLRSLWDG